MGGNHRLRNRYREPLYAATGMRWRPEKAIRLALNQSFPTVFTSGTIMIAAGFLVGYMTSDVTISVFGIAIGRGATISVLLVLLVLPQILLFGDKFIDKSALHMKPPAFIARRMKRNADRQTAGENAGKSGG